MELFQNVNQRAVQNTLDISSSEPCCACHLRSRKAGKRMEIEVVDYLLNDEEEWYDECNN